jgi:hypothetical protein
MTDHLKGHASLAEMVSTHIASFREALKCIRGDVLEVVNGDYWQHELNALSDIEHACTVERAARATAEQSETLIQAHAEIERLNAIINTPHADDFMRAVSIEAEHQRQRWGAEGDAGKTPADWFWLIGYLAGKALHAHAAGNTEKCEHHIITTAAACANWHRALFGKTDMRPGHEEGTAMLAATASRENI